MPRDVFAVLGDGLCLRPEKGQKLILSLNKVVEIAIFENVAFCAKKVFP